MTKSKNTNMEVRKKIETGFTGISVKMERSPILILLIS